mmetsp:Transcript_21401/g.59524  ORF Transcript_21401/g.59524 Transcript_21401/m.59524 type:complete len:579 (+) Transcript_21401:141-1877(+)|eukprot:CAMPEP_0172365780 /NCGR_PEP_ID=MMETSP1060-20121228/11984_1 /TAXON_ID=37318 /ORGANISM="Pseudo-nitzschia pungens, Strain cf. cingulata" /LENGTH=578 /DNA_ID=CAMNT_0013089309 /DNA_START=74 /DNA_END=1810 /DNA_ORIENTATION=+
MADWFSAAKEPEEEEELDVDAPVQEGILHHDTVPFPTRRSPFISRHGCVASSQPLASSIGLDLLRRGANAAEAAIGVSAALGVTEPCSCGLGGDMFCLYYDASTKKVTAFNASGKSASGISLEKVRADCPTPDDYKFSAHAVTVPGTARGYEDLLKKHGSGKFTLADVLEPAAQLAEEGFPIQTTTAHHWTAGMAQIKKWVDDGEPVPLSVDGSRGPKTGEIIYNPDLARVLRDLGAKGSDEGFYKGETGKAIVEAVQKHGGVMTMEDLANCETCFPDPICTSYHNVKLWEVPPNGQGIAALIALKGIEAIEEGENEPGSLASYHRMIEMMRLAFADVRAHVADSDHMKVTCDQILDEERLTSRAKNLFDPEKAAIPGCPDPSSCTVSFQVADKDGNAISFVNSNYMGFGTGIVPKGCGFTLQNRGFGFQIGEGKEDHCNVLAPNKRPYHTILPGMITYKDTDELYATISNMGGNMQPQGHLQLTVHMVNSGLDPQAAIDMPRFCIADGTQSGRVLMEKEVPTDVVKKLKEMGHKIQSNVDGHARAIFGRAQIIKKDPTTGVWWAGSDGRADGCAMGY